MLTIFKAESENEQDSVNRKTLIVFGHGKNRPPHTFIENACRELYGFRIDARNFRELVATGAAQFTFEASGTKLNSFI